MIGTKYTRLMFQAACDFLVKLRDARAEDWTLEVNDQSASIKVVGQTAKGKRISDTVVNYNHSRQGSAVSMGSNK
jgi:hypothetical protein